MLIFLTKSCFLKFLTSNFNIPCFVLNFFISYHFVLLDKETRGLHADDEVLTGDYFGLALSDFGPVAHCPCFYFPGREILGHIDLNFREPVLIRVQF